MEHVLVSLHIKHLDAEIWEVETLAGSDFIRGLAGWELCLLQYFVKKTQKDTW